MTKITIFLNYIENFFLIKSKKIKIYIINKKNYICINLNNSIKINKNINTLTIIKPDNKKKKCILYENLNYFLKKINNFYLKKIQFVGKGFKIKKIKKKCFLLFNKAHKVYHINKSIKLKKITKTGILITSKNNNLNILEKKIKYLFIQNIFTRKGIRSSRQLVKIKKK